MFKHPKIKNSVEELKAAIPIGTTVVFTNGCFDLLHEGHIYLLHRAQQLGELLVVGINTDASVKKIKGESRPIENTDTRCMHLAAQECVDFVISFDEDTPTKLIAELRPHILVKGGDYTPETIAGADIVLNNAGKVIIIPLLEGYSTTKKIEGK